MDGVGAYVIEGVRAGGYGGGYRVSGCHDLVQVSRGEIGSSRPNEGRDGCSMDSYAVRQWFEVRFG